MPSPPSFQPSNKDVSSFPLRLQRILKNKEKTRETLHNFSLGIFRMSGLPAQSTASVISMSIPQKDQASGNVTSAPDSKPKKKICCACPETKKLRDECIVMHGEDSCEKWIEAHRRCLRAEGFNV